jgi:hypothetical protein
MNLVHLTSKEHGAVLSQASEDRNSRYASYAITAIRNYLNLYLPEVESRMHLTPSVWGTVRWILNQTYDIPDTWWKSLGKSRGFMPIENAAFSRLVKTDGEEILFRIPWAMPGAEEKEGPFSLGVREGYLSTAEASSLRDKVKADFEAKVLIRYFRHLHSKLIREKFPVGISITFAGASGSVRRSQEYGLSNVEISVRLYPTPPFTGTPTPFYSEGLSANSGVRMYVQSSDGEISSHPDYSLLLLLPDLVTVARTLTRKIPHETWSDLFPTDRQG